jgi:hypothetical protein
MLDLFIFLMNVLSSYVSFTFHRSTLARFSALWALAALDGRPSPGQGAENKTIEDYNKMLEMQEAKR